MLLHYSLKKGAQLFLSLVIVTYAAQHSHSSELELKMSNVAQEYFSEEIRRLELASTTVAKFLSQSLQSGNKLDRNDMLAEFFIGLCEARRREVGRRMDRFTSTMLDLIQEDESQDSSKDTQNLSSQEAPSPSVEHQVYVDTYEGSNTRQLTRSMNTIYVPENGDLEKVDEKYSQTVRTVRSYSLPRPRSIAYQNGPKHLTSQSRGKQRRATRPHRQVRVHASDTEKTMQAKKHDCQKRLAEAKIRIEKIRS